MVPLTALWLPILLSAVLVFLASSLIHMAIPIHKNDYRKLPDEDKVLDVLRSTGVTSGRGYIMPFCDHKNMKSPEVVEKFKRERRESITSRSTVRSPASVNHELNVLSKIFNLATDYGVTDTNPCRKVKKYPLDNKRYRYLLPEEEPALMAALSGRRAHLKPMVKIAIGTGMRQGEQLSLTWDRVDFSRGVLIVTKTKSGKDREIPMNPEVFEILRAMREKSTGKGYVFVSSKTGTRVKEVKTAFVTALREAKIEGLVWHDLRATFGTRLGEAGFDAFTIAALMGHSDIHTTARYVRATERNKREAVKAAMLSSQTVVHKLATRPNQRAASAL